jgi:lipopolysaccharide cholinephosphotransferase
MNNDYGLEEIQKSLLDILIDIDRVCRENNINYSLIGGTILGAIRHK